MPIGDPWDGFFYPTLTLMKDSYNAHPIYYHSYKLQRAEKSCSIETLMNVIGVNCISRSCQRLQVQGGVRYLAIYKKAASLQLFFRVSMVFQPDERMDT